MKSWSALAILISLALAAPQRPPSFGVEEEEPVRKLGEPGQPQAFQDRPPAINEQEKGQQHGVMGGNSGRASPLAALSSSAEGFTRVKRHPIMDFVKRQTARASPLSGPETALDNPSGAPAGDIRFPPPSSQVGGSNDGRGKGVYGYSTGRPIDEDHIGGKTWYPCDPEHDPEWKECLRKLDEHQEREEREERQRRKEMREREEREKQ
ncbi:hypothetical protein GQ602_004811 [Ophiocordyceps camponoti-floridani]|uniref:Uncharacterized protein n=1 Tax=Ophiocordyceps camponoti-floridani TaxID=2030778 RepID=A0A8H4Q4G8_9HYPO|nr:hypothetical protein GQ602_004811 [Ophiocordyceps camponoti-floridani]